MSPPLAGTEWRELAVGETEPLIVDGHIIPKGTRVGVSPYAIHHNEEYFPQPFVFKPERWLAGSAEDGNAEGGQAANSKVAEAFFAFSLGSRACAGKSMAYLEMSIVMAKTLWYFDFDFPEDTTGQSNGRSGAGGGGVDGEFEAYDILTSSHTGPNLLFRPRGDQVKELAEGT